MENSSEFKKSCPICGHIEIKLQDRNGEYTIYDCKNCKGSFSYPLEASINYSEVNKIPDKMDFDSVVEKSLRRNFNYTAALDFLDGIDRGSMLDIGSGPGVFLKHGANLGFKVYGMDLADNILSNFNNEKGGLEFSVSSAEDFKIPQNWPNKFKVISAIDVLEHVTDPLKVGNNIYSRLDEGGYFIGTIPNKDRYYYKLAKLIDDFVPIECGGDNPPYHLTFWKEHTVKVFLEKIGFKNYFIIKGGLLWRKNIFTKGKRLNVASWLLGIFYRYSSKMPISLIRLIERYGTHLVFIAAKDRSYNLRKIGLEAERKIYRKKTPFFKDGEIE